MKGKWRLERLDTLDDESYLLPGKYPDQKTAEEAAANHLTEQPKDYFYVIRPNGTKYRYLG